MSIEKTPAQNQESHRIRRNNGQISSLGQELKSSQALDRRFGTSQSHDTRRTASKLSDAEWSRDLVEKDLEKRLKSSNTSPKDKAHASAELNKIRAARSRQRDAQITGRQAKLTPQQRRTNGDGILRLKPR